MEQVVVLCDEGDASAVWAAQTLPSFGVPTKIVWGADLAEALRFEHRVGARGASFFVDLPDGSRLSRGPILNRLSYVPGAWLRRHGGPDRDYAVQEMFAFFISWLHCLDGAVLNRPSPQGLSGAWRHSSVWAALAGQSGLPTRRYRQSDADDPALTWTPPFDPKQQTVFVLGAEVCAPDDFPPPLKDSCLRLASLAQNDLLGVNFLRDALGGWLFHSATPMPDLMTGGHPLAGMLAKAFQS